MCSSLESKLIPEHVLRLCLEHDRNSEASHLPKNAYNFYKDSNASLLAKMVDPVTKLQERIRHLLSEWDDHPALQKIVDVIDMILSIPMDTPLAKAMSGLQFLLNRVRNLQETVAKLPLSAQLDPIIALVSTWQKMEFESWPALLDEVQARFDTNAAQLWFPLYSVLRQTDSADSQSIMQSLEEFIQTSSIGEFRKRLELVFAFHGHISTAIRHESNSSCGYEDSVKILYNTFGFCIHFLPNVMEQLASNRKTIEAELNELLKLCKWDRTEWYLTMETSKRTREKFKKLIQKYTDVLKQPMMLIFAEDAARRGIQTMANHVPNTFSDTFYKYKQVLDVACHETLFKSKKRYTFSGIMKQLNQQDDIDQNEEGATETVDESVEVNDGEEESNQENPEENGTETVTETSEMETEENNQENKTDADVDAPKNDVTAPVANDFGADHQSNDVSATKPNGRSNGTSMREAAPEATWSNTNDMQSDFSSYKWFTELYRE